MQHCLQQQSYRLHLNCELLAVVSNRAKLPSLLCMSILTRPRINQKIWWRRRVLPSGPIHLLQGNFIAIVYKKYTCLLYSSIE
ncbi:Hypothetical protein WP0203 [Wolbachia endosymbiont of Culex quinquefasciatus Pel]|nr:Hypothetical protein WP0203 [Wolbachia endosymbiont of Culex quinquefasciatus Pel]